MITTAPDLFRALARHAGLLEGLFEKRHRSVSLYEVTGTTPYEVLEQLSEDRIVEIVDDNIELDDRLQTFLEAFLDAGEEVELLDFDNLLADLDHHIGRRISAENESVFERSENRIRKILRKIPLNLIRNTALIHRHIELVFKAVADSMEKLHELEHYREKLAVLLNAETKITTKLRVHRDGYFQRFAGPDLRLQYFRLADSLHDLRVTLLDLNGEVIDYINRLNENSQFLEHILKLRDLKNRHEIKERTNLLALLADENDPLVLNRQKRDHAMLEESFADDVDFLEIVARLREQSTLPEIKRRRSGPIPKTILDSSREEETIDFDGFYEKFQQSGGDLLSFAIQYPYEKLRSEDEILLIYLQIATTYASELRFAEKTLEFAGYQCLTIHHKGALNDSR